DGALLLSGAGSRWQFTPQFEVFFTEQDPKLAMRPAGIVGVPYNVPSWQTSRAAGNAALKHVARDNTQSGDGFDDRILKGDTRSRTADVFASAPSERVGAVRWEQADSAIHYSFEETERFSFAATVTLPDGDAAEPELTFTLTPKVAGWFSVAYLGAPQVARED